MVKKSSSSPPSKQLALYKGKIVARRKTAPLFLKRNIQKTPLSQRRSRRVVRQRVKAWNKKVGKPRGAAKLKEYRSQRDKLLKYMRKGDKEGKKELDLWKLINSTKSTPDYLQLTGSLPSWDARQRRENQARSQLRTVQALLSAGTTPTGRFRPGITPQLLTKCVEMAVKPHKSFKK